jgi:hypothetical protein
MISQHAIDLWTADGYLLLPTDASKAAKERQRHLSGAVKPISSNSITSSSGSKGDGDEAVQQLKAAEIKINLD